jgi:UDP-glucose:(heptosyl)LPS alpha-1,3-glucosyltransferase
MNLAFCYENVDPTRGGCETYIADFARRLVSDGHEVHLYASRWNEQHLPPELKHHRIARIRGPRFLRPWRFSRACARSLSRYRHDVTIGFDKTSGQDVLYPQGGIYSASVDANLSKHRTRFARLAARAAKSADLAAHSFRTLERHQLSNSRQFEFVVNSEMVRRHAVNYLHFDERRIHVVHAAVDPDRFISVDRAAIRAALRKQWQANESTPVGLFVAMNYRLKGLEPLLRSLTLVPPDQRFRLVVVGHPEFSRYRRLACKLGIDERVTFHGFCADSRTIYFASDFLVHPTFYDPCSLVVLEALACGLPVITSRFNGAAELMRPPRDGLVVNDPHDRSELACAITHMLNSEYRTQCSVTARESATLWTFDDHYRKMMSILEMVADRKSVSDPLSRVA